MGLKSGLHADFAHSDSCPWCRIDRQKMNTLEKQELRTLENAREAAHLPPLDLNGKSVFPFTCKLCGVEFKTKEEWMKEDLTDPKHSKLFTQVHAGHVWRRPSLSCDPSHFILCLLHMKLSFCSSLWTWLIKPSAQVKKQEIADQVLAMLQKDGVNVWRLKKLNSTSEEACKNVGFTGAAAERVMGRFETYMQVLECKQMDKGLFFKNLLNN